jgi:hypothetical protein
MSANHDPAVVDVRIEALTRALEASPDAEASAAARELVRLVLQFHGAGWKRLLDILADAPSSVRQRTASDPLIAALLALHDLEPPGATDSNEPRTTTGSPLLQLGRPANTPIARHAETPSRCEHCGVPLGASHHHYVDVSSRHLSCSCRACWLSGSHGGSWRAVPDRYVAGGAFQLSDAQWDALQLPVAIAFFMFNSALRRTIAFYPSPAGATESSLPLAAWRDVEQENSWVRIAAPDVEAILVRRDPRSHERRDAFIVPIDACYDLVGRIRTNWSGFDGGDSVRAEVDRFFDEIALRSAATAASAAAPL